MRKKFLLLCRKLDWRFGRLYSWLLRTSFKSCGENVDIRYPVRLENPGSISLGSGTLLYPRTWLNVVSEWAGVKYHGEIQIGDRVMISYGVQISAAESIIIEDEVVIAAGVIIMDHNHGHLHLDTPVFRAPLSKPSPVLIGKNAFLGAYCFIGPGVHIGEHAVVSANAVVVNDVPAYSIAACSPSRSVRFHNPQGKDSALADVSGAQRV